MKPGSQTLRFKPRVRGTHAASSHLLPLNPDCTTVPISGHHKLTCALQ